MVTDKTGTLTVRLSTQTLAWLDEEAAKLGVTRGQVARRCIERVQRSLHEETAAVEANPAPAVQRPSSSPFSQSVKDAHLLRKVQEDAADRDPTEDPSASTTSPEGSPTPSEPWCRHPVNRRLGNGICGMCHREA